MSAEQEILRNGFVGFSKEIASLYVKPLLDEDILRVTRDRVQIRNLVVPRERVVYLHIALTQLRSPDSLYPIRQGANGFTVEKVKAARGNDVVDAYRITSNASDHTSILLTKKLAWELWEVIAFFIPVLDGPNTDNPLPKSVPFQPHQEESHAENFGPENFSDDDEEFEDDSEFEDDDEEDDGSRRYEYTPFPARPEGHAGLQDAVEKIINDFVMSNPNESFTWDGSQVTHTSTGRSFVLVSANEQEVLEWQDGEPIGAIAEAIVDGLQEYIDETYNETEESLDEEYPSAATADEVE